MRRRLSLRAGLALAASLVVATMLTIGCDDDDEGTPGIINPGGPDAAADRRGTGSTGDPKTGDDDDDDDDDDVAPKDAGKKDAGKDAGKKGGAERDANGPSGDGGTCSFNYDCQLGLRCECDGECACKAGTRGVGKAGGGCEDANDCQSAVCLDGPNDELLCSDECETADECPDLLPLCQNVSFVGRICTRKPPP